MELCVLGIRADQKFLGRMELLPPGTVDGEGLAQFRIDQLSRFAQSWIECHVGYVIYSRMPMMAMEPNAVASTL